MISAFVQLLYHLLLNDVKQYYFEIVLFNLTKVRLG